MSSSILDCLFAGLASASEHEDTIKKELKGRIEETKILENDLQKRRSEIIADCAQLEKALAEKKRQNKDNNEQSVAASARHDELKKSLADVEQRHHRITSLLALQPSKPLESQRLAPIEARRNDQDITHSTANGCHQTSNKSNESTIAEDNGRGSSSGKQSAASKPKAYKSKITTTTSKRKREPERSETDQESSQQPQDQTPAKKAKKVKSEPGELTPEKIAEAAADEFMKWYGHFRPPLLKDYNDNYSWALGSNASRFVVHTESVAREPGLGEVSFDQKMGEIGKNMADQLWEIRVYFPSLLEFRTAKDFQREWGHYTFGNWRLKDQLKR